MIKVAVLGATGYTALELIKILLRNPQAEITALTTRQEGSPPMILVPVGTFQLEQAINLIAEIGQPPKSRPGRYCRPLPSNQSIHIHFLSVTV